MQTRIQDLWNALAEFGPARSDEALNHVMAELSAMIGARQACWFGAVRIHSEGDPLNGWRPSGGIHFMHSQDERNRAYVEHCKRLRRNDIDPTVITNLLGAGSFRVNIRDRIVPPGWYESEFYLSLMKPFGIRDAIYMATPVNGDLESWLGFERIGLDEPPFGDAERDLLTAACSPLKWFHRQVAMQRGLLVADKPLTEAERRLLPALLGGGSEAEIAAQLGLTPATVHTYATRIYRKYNVKGRTGLTALWLWY